MPRIQGNPDARSASAFPAWRAGEYQLNIEGAEAVTAKSGKAKLEL